MWSILVEHGKLSFSLQSKDVQIPIIVCLTHKCIQLDINGHEISYKLFASQSQNVSKGTYTHKCNTKRNMEVWLNSNIDWDTFEDERTYFFSLFHFHSTTISFVIILEPKHSVQYDSGFFWWLMTPISTKNVCKDCLHACSFLQVWI